MSQLRTVDCRDLYSTDEVRQQQFVDTVGESLQEIGFVAIRSHEIDSKLVNRSYQSARKFFELNDELKQRYHHPESGGQRGYTGFGKEHAKDSPIPDLKEFYQIGTEPFAEIDAPATQNGDGIYPNIWPKEIDSFASVMTELYRVLSKLALDLLDACSLYINMPKNYLREIATGGDSILRLVHYPPVPANVPAGSMRAAPHEDINLITLLCGSTAAGLQIQARDGQWLDIDPHHDHIIVDSGDMLQNLTNGILRSTTHRVVNNGDQHASRFSMPFFAHPCKSADLTPLPDCVARSGGRLKFPAITAGEFLQQRLNEIGLTS